MKKFFKKKTADEKNSPLKKAGKSDKLKENKSVNMDNEADEKEFESFFSEVIKKFPEKTSSIILNSYGKSKERAEKIMAKSKNQFGSIFDEFLKGVDDDTRKKCHKTVHAASLTAAIVGCSPIPFSDAFLLVPIQLTMMARLHKIFGQSWSESMGKSIGKEIVVVGLGKSAVGNIIKFIPGVGTVAGAAINATVASTITETLGWVTVKMLNDGEDIFEQTMTFKGQFKTLFDAVQNSSKKSK
ncbi:YcjF family protein [Candidatus Enterococcus ikei]|uniref:YcjF family protein n=1 Tax=Candidatus Enterococcus ikei TaxID=2815326 RepID=A0ABS3GY35_9ENTE|nr:YcjF family protein [Enterococcus sp. DIV0869a]MBO0440172.1 YcjF family protein [Enterococcus sp. DIV0869a]